MIQRVEAGRDLTAASLCDLGRALPDLVGRGVTLVRLDVSRVVEFDSAALEALLEFDALARSRGLEVEVSGAPELLVQALLVTGLSTRLTLAAKIISAAASPAETAPKVNAKPVAETRPTVVKGGKS